MAKTADEIIEFSTHNQPAHCRVRVNVSDDSATAVATELMEDNGGPSITNAAEWAWATIVEKFGVKLLGTTFVEHYRKREGETFDIVTFERKRLEGPKWSRISRQVLEEVIGEPWLIRASPPKRGRNGCDKIPRRCRVFTTT